MNNSFGGIFRITSFGESHGKAIGVVIDGVPPGHPISLDKVQEELDRRRPGQSHLSTPRDEKDRIEALSGLVNGVTLGTPLTLVVFNKDAKAHHYKDINTAYRPSHADYTTQAKFGVRAPSGGGRASARETIARVAASAIAKQILQSKIKDFEVLAFVDSVKGVKAEIGDLSKISKDDVEDHPLRCPDKKNRSKMEEIITQAKDNGDSVGGTILCLIKGCPAGLGGPVFDKLEADLAKAMMSIPATKGFEIGNGFNSTDLYGSENNDAFYMDEDRVRTRSNRSGGIQGGISNGEQIYFRTAFKPVSTIFKEQDTVNEKGENVKFKPKKGRHDPCVLPRAVPIVESMATLVIMDHYLREEALKAASMSF